ncbi:hypothetical protein LguiA_035477 [Lonicera macranthoides]
MELVDDPFDSSTKVEEKVEPGSLLEQGWFFGNFLDKKRKMLRCYSDPCPSSNPTQEMLVRKSYDHQNSSSASSKTKVSSKENGGSLRLNKPNLCTNGLVRAPSLPPCIGKVEVDDEDEDEDDEESEFTMGRLIRQASLNLSDILPPPHTSKVIKQSYSGPRQHPRRKPEIGETITNKTKSRDDLESEEVQGSKDLGFHFEKLNLNPSVVNILPGLQDKVPGPGHDEEEEEELRRPYLSEAWQVQSSATPTLPNWAVDKKNSSKDMKAQIKFWARAVASNVRQEC